MQPASTAGAMHRPVVAHHNDFGFLLQEHDVDRGVRVARHEHPDPFS
jgi:hypothetical protein